MGTIYAEITLKNAIDAGDVQRGYLMEQEVRSAAVRALVDTGCGTLVINEHIRDQLELATEGLRSGTLADGAKKVCQLTEPVKNYREDRYTTCPAIVIPGAHGDEVLCLLK